MTKKIEFKEVLEFMISHDREYNLISKNGNKYVECNYNWNIVIKKYVNMIDKI